MALTDRAHLPQAAIPGLACYEDLLAAGVKIHLYRGAFLHAKHASIDDCVAAIGSSNLDIRSFALNSDRDSRLPPFDNSPGTST
jgi:cardiolipin synthase